MALEEQIQTNAASLQGTAEMKEQVSKISGDIAGMVDQLKTLQEAAQAATARQDEFEAHYGQLPDMAKGRGLVQTIAKQAVEQFDPGLMQFKNGLNVYKAVYTGSLLKSTITNATTGAGAAGALVRPFFMDEVIEIAKPQLTVLELLNRVPVTSDHVEYEEQSVAPTEAGPQENQGDIKEESDMRWVDREVLIRTYAHFIRASTQVLADAPRLENLINTDMRFYLRNNVEVDALYGTGTAGQLNGLTPNVTAFNTALLTTMGITGVQNLDRIRAAIVQVQQNNYMPTGILMNPLDWGTIEVLKDSQFAYLFAFPQNAAVPRLWGLPVIVSTNLQNGDVLVGNFRMGAYWFDREMVTLAYALEDVDNFVRNRVTIKAEVRLAIGIVRPLAIVYLQLPTAGSGS